MNKFTIFQLVQLVLFALMAVFICMRGIDGHGTVQTLSIKLQTLAIWGGFYLGLLAVEWIPYGLYRLIKR